MFHKPTTQQLAGLFKPVARYQVGQQSLILEKNLSNSVVRLRLTTTQCIDAPRLSSGLKAEEVERLQKVCAIEPINIDNLMLTLKGLGSLGPQFATALQQLLASERLVQKFSLPDKPVFSLETMKLGALREEEAALLELMKKSRGFYHANIEKQLTRVQLQISEFKPEKEAKKGAGLEC